MNLGRTPLRIGIDTSRTAEAKTGLGSYAASLLAALARIDRVNDYVLHPFTWHCFVKDYQNAFCPRAENFRNARWWLPRRLVARWWELNRVSKDRLVGGPHDVFFSPFHAVPPRQMGKLVCVFHDVAFFAHPEFTTEVNLQICTSQIDLARRCADLIVTVSEFSKREILRYVNVAPDRVRVIKEAADPRFQFRDIALPERLREGIGNVPFTLFVGSVEPRKNLATLIEAWALLAARGRALGKLVIAGGSGWKNSDVFAAVERHRLQDSVHFTGFVTDDELVALYNKARVFVYPSLYEGFGLPVLEAMACGAPVVTARVASLPEVGGDAALYVDEPRDAEALAEALASVQEDAALRGRLRAEGFRQAASFSWEATAAATLAVLEEVVADRRFDRHRVTIGQDERGLDQGWHPPERAGDFEFRWMAREATLALTPTGGPFVLEVGTPLGDGEQRLDVHCGRRRIGSFVLRHGWQRLEVPANGASRDRPQRITLRASRGLDARHRGDDPRDLALMVRSAGWA